ncbi:MAG: insulinase family protein [Acidobacteriota bacterium]|nr:insulinase family protein [Acidobacteriota bacterium]
MIRPFTLAIVTVIVASAQTVVRHAPPLPSYKSLKYAPLPPLKIPEPETFTLPNGMKIYLLEHHELPVISGFALVRTGNLFDPADKHGLAGITGELIRAGGTKDKSGDQIDVELENIAASVESQIGESSGTVSFSALKENTDAVLAVFHDLFTTPEFRQDKLDLAKTQTRSAIARRNDDPNGIVSREFGNILYGRNNPYGWDISYADIDRIQRADVVNFYQRYFFPANTALAIYGDFSQAEMKQKLTRLFANWTVKQPPVPKFPEVQKTPVPGVFLATKEDVAQTFFEVGHMGGLLNDKDYPALEVAADILGGGFSSRLFQRIRTRLGYAYHIGSSWGAGYDHPGLFRISGSTQSMRTVDTLKAITEELNRIRTGEVTEAELQTAKDTVLNGFVFRFDRPSKTLNRLVQYEYYGYPKDFVFQYQKGIQAVTRQDVARVAKKYFRPEDLTIVAVGNPKEFKTPITELGLKVQPIDLTIPEPAKEATKSDSSTLDKGKQLLLRMQKALGGPEKLTSVKDADYRGTVAIQAGGGLKIQQHNRFLAPASLRQDIEAPFGKQSVYFDGQAGWVAGPQGAQPLPAPVVKQVRGELFRQLFSLGLSDRAADRTVNAVGESAIEISDKQGESVRIQLDPATGLPRVLTYDGAGAASPVKIEETYSDWRDVNGVKTPFKIVIQQDAKKFADVVIDEFKINSGLTSEVLSKKP